MMTFTAFMLIVGLASAFILLICGLEWLCSILGLIKKD